MRKKKKKGNVLALLVDVVPEEHVEFCGWVVHQVRPVEDSAVGHLCALNGNPNLSQVGRRDVSRVKIIASTCTSKLHMYTIIINIIS